MSGMYQQRSPGQPFALFGTIETEGLRILIDCGPDFREQMIRLNDFKPLDGELTANKPVTKYVLFMTDAYTWLAQIFIGIMELTSFLFYIALPND